MFVRKTDFRIELFQTYRKLNFQPGSQSPSHYQPRQHACRSADAVLLCYKISDPTTLFSALEQWAPAVRAVAPDTPIVLVGCQSELRFDYKLKYARMSK